MDFGTLFHDCHRAITDTPIAISLTFFFCLPCYHVHPSTGMLTKKSQLQLTFLLLCQSWLAKICMSETSTHKSCFQEQPCFFPNSTLHARHIHVLFELCGKSFLSLQSSDTYTSSFFSYLQTEITIPFIPKEAAVTVTVGACKNKDKSLFNLLKSIFISFLVRC